MSMRAYSWLHSKQILVVKFATFAVIHILSGRKEQQQESMENLKHHKYTNKTLIETHIS